MRKTRPYTYLGTVQGMCRKCRKLVPARILKENGKIHQEKLCPSCGNSRALIAENADWYEEMMATSVHCHSALQEGTPVEKGCPHDCGPCRFHANACHLPVFSITNACNLACPICFTYNRNDKLYHMSREEIRNLLDKVIARVGPLDLINITGGEPSLHPNLFELLDECNRPEIGRITMNSNGLKIAKDEDFCRELAKRGIYVILSFDTLKPENSIKIHGQDIVETKLKALENLQKHGIGVTLLNVMIKGVNDREIGEIIGLSRNFSVVRSVTVQTMTFTGMGGKQFEPREHMPLDGAAEAIERTTNGDMKARDFFPHPGAHPLCYSVAYYLKKDRKFRSLTDLFDRSSLREMLGGGYLLQMDETVQDRFKEAVDRIWAEGKDPDVLADVKGLISKLYPPGKSFSRFDRQRLGEESVLTVYLHAHMDEDNLDLSRLVCCPDQVPDPEGRMIPACSYNLFYRQKDPRFWKEGVTSQ